LGSAFDSAKEGIKAKLKEMFKPLREAWLLEIKPTLAELQAEWYKFTITLKLFWYKNIQPVVDKFKKFIPEDLAKKLGEISGVVLVVAAAFGVLAVVAGIVSGLLSFILSPIGLILAAVTLLALAWTQNWGDIQGKTQAVWDKLKPIMEDVKEVFETLKTFWEEKLQPVVEVLTNYMTTYVIPLWAAVADLIGVILVKALEMAWAQIANFFTPAIKEAKRIFKIFSDWLGTKGITPIEKLRDVLEKIGSFLKDVIDRIQTFKDKIKNLKIPDWMTGNSPSPIENTLRNMRDYLKDMADTQLPGFGRALSSMPPMQLEPAGAGFGGETNYNYSMEVNTQAEKSTLLQDWETFRYLAPR